MFRSGAENMFMGDAGAVTYMFLIVLVSLASIGRISVVMRDRAGAVVRGMGTGMLLMVVSRLLNVSELPYEHVGYAVLSSLMGIVGFYMMMTMIASGKRQADFSFINKTMLVAAVVSGVVFGSTIQLALLGNIVLLTMFFSFAIFVPAGVLAGFFLERRKIRFRMPSLFSVSAVFLMVSTAMLSLKPLGMSGSDPFWGQLFSLIDLAGFFLFLAAFVSESPPIEDEQGKTPKQAEIKSLFTGTGAIAEASIKGRKLVEISLMVISGDREQSIYRSIALAIKEETGANFVTIRTVIESDDRFETKAFVTDAAAIHSPRFRIAIKKTRYQHFCSDKNAAGYGYKLDKESLGEDADSFVPEDIDWESGDILVMPVRMDGVLKATITAGFFEKDPSAAFSKVLWIYSNNIIEIYARENFKERIKNGKRTLSIVQDELETANQLKSNFLSIVSHELRTPLTSIKAYSEALLDNIETIEPETTRNFLNVMGEESDRVIKLVDNMLSYSSMEAGHLKVEKGSCNLNRIIRETARDLGDDFESGEVENILRLPSRDVVIDADEELMRQLLLNLASNAIKFTPAKGKVTISLEEEASAVRIVVQDTGNGIPEDQLEKIFERFHQADASNTREYGGSGLGLAICKNIVEWHGGRIWVENVKEAGAKFVIIIPMKDIIIRQSTSTGNIGSIRFEREKYLSLLVEMLSEFMQARKASIMILDEDKQILRVIAAKGLDAEFVQNTRVEPGERIAGKVFLEGESVHVFDIEADGRMGRTNNSAYYGTSSFISLPIKEAGDVVGVLNVSDHVDGREFTKADMEILEAFSGIIGGMLKKLTAYETVSYNFEKVRNAMRSVLDIREEVGGRNLVNYTLVALAAGDRLGLSEESMTALRMGMNMYDLGMMKVPRSIRVKKEELTLREKKKLLEHSNMGFAMLSPMGLDERIMMMVRCHHEYYDGSGYPEGLVGEEIPMEARIINVVDSFRALISQGPYRRAFSLDEAKNEIIRGARTKFDPKVVGAFVKVLHETGARVDEGDFILDAIEKELEEIRKENKRNYDTKRVKEEIK